jgi:hypothetical protein
MMRKTALIAGLLMLGALAAPQVSSAASPLPVDSSSIAADTSLVEKTRYRRHRHWRHRHWHHRHWHHRHWHHRHHRHCRWHYSPWRGWHRHCHGHYW